MDEARSGLGSLEKIEDIFAEENADADEDGTQHEKGGNKCEHVFNDTANGRTITLTYQQSYSNANGADDDGKKSAHIVEQIPDIVMTIRENGSGNEYTYLFDAKYQIMSLPSAAKPETDAAPYRTINEMHRYRDAILYRRQKASGDNKGKLTHEVIGAYVLYPGRPDKSFNYKKFIEEENIGAIPLLPGTDGTKFLHEFLDYVLKHQDAQSHLSTAIPTRGTTMVVGEAVGEGEMMELDAIFTATEWAALSKKNLWAIGVDELERKGKEPAHIRFVSVKVAGHAVMTVRVALSPVHPTAVTAEQARRCGCVLPTTSSPSAAYRLYSVDQSGPLHV